MQFASKAQAHVHKEKWHGQVVAVTWARARWSAAAAWVGGTPLVIGALWICSDLAVRLLPNLM